MTSKRLLILFLVVILIIFYNRSLNGVQVRFVNKSSADFKQVDVNIQGKEMTFENLKSGHSTNDIKVPSTYRYCFIRIITESDTLMLRPIDYVGETLYKTGKMTFILKISSSSNNKPYLEIDSKRSLF